MRSPLSNVRINASLIRERFLHHEERKFFTRTPSRGRYSSQSNSYDGLFLGIKDGSEELIIRTPYFDWRAELSKRRPREDAAGPFFQHPGIACWMTRIREPREPKLLIDLRLANADLLPPISAEPSKPRRVHIRNSVDRTRFGCTLGGLGCEEDMQFLFCRVIIQNDVEREM